MNRPPLDEAAALPGVNQWRRLYLTPRVLVVLTLFALSCWGTLDGFIDADGDRMFGAVPIVAPAILAIWLTISVAWTREVNLGEVLARFLFAGFASGLPLIGANVLFMAVAWAMPENQALIAANPDFHYWWEESIGSQLVLTGLAGFMAQLVGALAAFIIVTLPVLSIRRPAVATEGSHLAKIEDEGRRTNTAAFVFCGFGAFVLGLILTVATEGFELDGIIAEVNGVLESIQRRYAYPEEWVWLAGVVLLAGGAVSMVWACVQVVIARRRYAERGA